MLRRDPLGVEYSKTRLRDPQNFQPLDPHRGPIRTTANGLEPRIAQLDFRADWRGRDTRGEDPGTKETTPKDP